MRIDVHAHCIPAAFVRWLEADGGPARMDPADNCVRFSDGSRLGPLRADLTDVTARLAAMDAIGVDRQLLAGWIDLTAYELDPDEGRHYSRAYNECLASEAARHPDRFGALGTVPLQEPESAALELEHAMGELGMNGIQIATRVAGVRPDRVGLDPLWETAERLGALVVLHPMRPLEGIDLDGYFLDNVVGRAAETTISAASLILSGVLERFPDLKLVAVHGGGYLPFQVGRLDRGYRQKPALVGADITRPPSDYLKMMYVDTVVHSPSVLRFVVEVMGADHVLLGTDYPFEMGDDNPIGLIEAAVASPVDRAAIAGETLADLLRS